MKFRSLLVMCVFGCSVNTTGLQSATDAGLRDGVLPDGPTGECVVGESRACASDLGACQSGSQRCEGGSWGACEGAIGPSPEICDPANVDEDCDGMGNEDCPCVNGEVQECGMSATLPCRLGTATCVNGSWSAECVGAVLPQEETCNDIDDDCDSATDEGVRITFYRDVDGDGVGTGTTIDACEKPANYSTVVGDCNDNDVAMYPGNSESCDGKDNDCNGNVDEGFPPTTYYLDDDSDDYGDDDDAVSTCAPPPAGYIEAGGDCDDSNADINPDATEVCDLVDNDCNGARDDGPDCRSDCSAAEFGGHVYQFCNHNRNWDGAVGRCADMGASGIYQLVTIETVEENTFLNNTGRTYSTTEGWWIGLNDERNEGRFVWLSGSDSTYRRWGATEPNNSGNEDCGELRADGFWNDTGCGDQYWYICEQSL